MHPWGGGGGRGCPPPPVPSLLPLVLTGLPGPGPASPCRCPTPPPPHPLAAALRPLGRREVAPGVFFGAEAPATPKPSKRPANRGGRWTWTLGRPQLWPWQKVVVRPGGGHWTVGPLLDSVECAGSMRPGSVSLGCPNVGGGGASQLTRGVRPPMPRGPPRRSRRTPPSPPAAGPSSPSWTTRTASCTSSVLRQLQPSHASFLQHGIPNIPCGMPTVEGSVGGGPGRFPLPGSPLCSAEEMPSLKKSRSGPPGA